MDKALLLPTLYGIVTRVKIGDQDTLIARQKLMHNRRLACLRHPEDHMDSVGEDPHVMVSTLDVNGCFIDVNKRACQHVLNKQALGSSVVTGKVIEEVSDCPFTDRLIKQILHHLNNEPIRQAQHESLVHYPRLQSMPKQLGSGKFIDFFWAVVTTAFLAIPFCSHILCNSFSAAICGEDKINNRSFSHFR